MYTIKIRKHTILKGESQKRATKNTTRIISIQRKNVVAIQYKLVDLHIVQLEGKCVISHMGHAMMSTLHKNNPFSIYVFHESFCDFFLILSLIYFPLEYMKTRSWFCMYSRGKNVNLQIKKNLGKFPFSPISFYRTYYFGKMIQCTTFKNIFFIKCLLFGTLYFVWYPLTRNRFNFIKYSNHQRKIILASVDILI